MSFLLLDFNNSPYLLLSLFIFNLPTTPKERVKILSYITERPNVTTAPTFDKIYADLKNKLEAEEYPFNAVFPTEHELATSEDKAWLEIDDYNCLAVLSGRVFNSDGIQFEYTESRYRPDYFCFEDTAIRHKFNG